MFDVNWYYVYTFAYPDGTVFYVGKGQGDGCMSRIRGHLYQAVGERITVPRVISVIRSIWQEGGKVIIRKPYKDLSSDEALRLERELINFYGYEQLVNIPPMSGYQKKLLKQQREAMIAKDGAIIL